MTDTAAANDGAPAPIGHNNPPNESPEEIQARLKATYEHLSARMAELLDMGARLPSPGEIDDEWEKKLSDGRKALNAFMKRIEANRVDEKEPFLAAERAVDGFFKAIDKPIADLENQVGAMLTVYQTAKAREEQRRRDELARVEREKQQAAERAARAAEEAARKTKAEADAKIKAAVDQAARDRAQKSADEAKAKADAARELAEQARDTAEQARQDTKAKPAELSRARTDLGVVSSLRTVWTFEIKDSGKVPREFCTPNDGLIKAAIKAATDKAGQCALKIAGIRIFQKSDTVTR